MKRTWFIGILRAFWTKGQSRERSVSKREVREGNEELDMYGR